MLNINLSNKSLHERKKLKKTSYVSNLSNRAIVKTLCQGTRQNNILTEAKFMLKNYKNVTHLRKGVVRIKCDIKEGGNEQSLTSYLTIKIG